MCSSVRLTCKEVLGFLSFTIGALIITYTTLGLPYYKGIGLLRFSGLGVSQDPPMAFSGFRVFKVYYRGLNNYLYYSGGSLL